MVNLFGKGEKPAKPEFNTEQSSPRVDLKKYQDPEGLSIQKLEIGLWFIEHKEAFKRIFYAILILIALLTWPRFFWTFGEYVVYGMKQDRQMAGQLADGSLAQTLMMAQSQRPQPLQWQLPHAIVNDNGTYDFLVRVKNPNDDFKADFVYGFGNDRQRTEAREGFIFPGETKYLVFPGSDNNISPLNLAMDSVAWTRINGHNFPDWEAYLDEHYDFTVSGRELAPPRENLVSEKSNVSLLSFKLKNNTAYNFYEVRLTVLLYRGTAVAGAEQVAINNVLSEEEREISMSLMGDYSGVGEIAVYPEVDITDPGVFMYRSVGPAEPK